MTVPHENAPALPGSRGTNQWAHDTRLALRKEEAAKSLGIGIRFLQELTNRGEIPHVHVGRVVLYPIAGLQAWLEARSKGGAS